MVLVAILARDASPAPPTGRSARAPKSSRGSAPPAAAPQAPGPKRSSLAINLASLHFWSHEWMFADLIKRARDWSDKPGPKYTVDANGWLTWLAPGARAVAQIGDAAPDFPRNFPLGRYVALHAGKGRVSVECRSCREISRSERRVVVDVLDSNYVRVVIESSDARDPVRDVRLVPLELERSSATQPFHPRFLEGLRPFAAIRYSGVQRVNGSLQAHWADRTRATAAFQDADGGVALEYLVELSNATATDPWFCIPPRADDDYVRNFARLVFTRLAPDRKVYVEYGNEIWNDADPYAIDGRWMSAEARRLKISLGDDEESDTTYKLRFQVIRSRRIFEIFQGEMAALGIDRRRLVRVIASHGAYHARIRFTLDYRFPDGTAAYQHADALAVAPYFAGLWSDREARLAEQTWTPAEVLNYAECAVSDPDRLPAFCAGLPFDSVARMIREDRQIAAERGLRLLGYEGGQHLFAADGAPAFVDKLASVNRAPRMKDVYTKYLETWRANGGELMFLLNYVFPYNRWGSWGLLERQDQPVREAPKMDAALRFIDSQAPWWNDPWPPPAPAPQATQGGKP